MRIPGVSGTLRPKYGPLLAILRRPPLLGAEEKTLEHHPYYVETPNPLFRRIQARPNGRIIGQGNEK